MNRLICSALILFAACTPTPPRTVGVGAVPDDSDDTCGGASYAALIGQDATALERVLILDQVRILRPGMMVTQEYRAARLNFRIGVDNRIVEIRCG